MLAKRPDQTLDMWEQPNRHAPLAERMRPRSLEEFVGQGHLVGQGGVLERLIREDRLPSMILRGPPGSGKTTLARMFAAHSNSVFVPISATAAGVKDLRAAVEVARVRRRKDGRGTILFVDEIHRFNKSQQDALLPDVEAGVCTLVGATTENPSFEVNAALLSRARVFQLRELEVGELVRVLRMALEQRERGLASRGLRVDDTLLTAIAESSQGDARRALTTLELASDLLPDDAHELTRELVARALGRRDLRYDRAGEEHYNVVSAFIKSMRASDVDAAVYWLARMLEAGEDPMFVARRIVIFASEDVGNADPQAIQLASAVAAATHLVGMPEAVLPLTQAVVYLSLAPKSNTTLRSYGAARKDALDHGALPVPLEIRNAVTKLMRDVGYGGGYAYPHEFRGGQVPGRHSYLPRQLAHRHYVEVGPVGWEAEAVKRLAELVRDAAASTSKPPDTTISTGDPATSVLRRGNESS